eukprot:gene11707-biopygen8475
MGFLSGCSPFGLTTHILNIIACTACGCYSVYLFYLLLVKEKRFSFTDLQSYIALIYIVVLAVFMTAVELRTLRHRHLIVLAFFLFFPMGRGFALIFMGAVLLGALVWGWIVGGVAIAIGVLNIVFAFTSGRNEGREHRVELE